MFSLLILFNLIFFKARSTKGASRLSAKERAFITISEDLKEILVGILLGDAHVVRRSLTSNSRLVYAQSEKHKEYFNYVFNYFKPYFVKDYIIQNRTINDKRTKKTYNALAFTTMQLPCFNIFREMFYKLNIKVVPNNIYELLTPKGLAFWIMDDGSRHGDGLHISVYAFSNEDIDKLMFVLQDKFKLKCSIHYNRDQKPRIYIFKESLNDLIDLVRPYFIKEMLYKLGL